MKYTTSTKEGKLHILFSIDTQSWEGYMDKAYQENKGKYNVPGFRKGHTPRKVLESNYGAGLFFEDALYIAASTCYGEYLDANKDVIPVARPLIDEQSIKTTDKGVEFAVVVVIKPEVTLGQYKGLTIKKTKVEKVGKDEVEAELKRVAERNSRKLEVTDRAVADGDEVNLDYSGSVDGVQFQGGTAQAQTLVIGSKTFIEGFEEQLIGMTIGESRDINVKFPDQYHSEELAGKAAVFAVKINGISVKELPQLDDEFAKDVSEFDTLADYKADIKAKLVEERTKTAERKDESSLVETVVNNAKFDVPVEMIEEQIDEHVEEFKYQLMYQGLKIEDYLKYTNSTIETLRENYRERATNSVRTRLVFEQIVKEENIKADKEGVDAKIAEYAKQSGQDVAEFEAGLQPDQMAYFENQVITEKLLDLLKKENTIA